MSLATEITALRERLGALSDNALRELAKKEGIEVPPDVAKVLLIDLLLEVLGDEFEEQDLQNNDSVRLQRIKYDLAYIEKIEETGEDTVFPSHYNDMRIVLMLRDPFWAFAYWDTKGGSLKFVKKEHEADGIVLRVLRLKSAAAGLSAQTVLDSFDIPLGINDSSRYVNIPQQDAFYSVSLVLQGKTWEKSLITSNTVRVPALARAEALAASDIVVLSEAGKLDVAQPGEYGVPGQQKSIPQRISSPETAQFLERQD
jgi:hypothetical protein